MRAPTCDIILHRFHRCITDRRDPLLQTLTEDTYITLFEVYTLQKYAAKFRDSQTATVEKL